MPCHTFIDEGKMMMIPDDTNEAFSFGLTDTKDFHYGEMQDAQHAMLPDVPSPIIGIPIPISQGSQGPLLLADAVGAWAIERMRGRVFLLPLWPFPTHTHVYQSLWPLMQSIDGLLLPAGIQGKNWYSHWKEHDSQPGPESWPLSWEMALAQLASFMGMPILAIGDGAEKWNVALGGSMMESAAGPLPEGPSTPERWDRHVVRVRAKTKLAADIQPALASQERTQKPWELIFMPQLGVKTLAPGLRVCAQSEDTAVVAFERRDPAFGLGIMGRIDWGLDQMYGTTLFDAFLRACRSFDLTRQQQQGWESSRATMCAMVTQRVTLGQPLIAVPQDTHEETYQNVGHRSGSLSSSTSSLNGSVGSQSRFQQRPHAPTKEELNRIRRRRLKATSR